MWSSIAASAVDFIYGISVPSIIAISIPPFYSSSSVYNGIYICEAKFKFLSLKFCVGVLELLNIDAKEKWLHWIINVHYVIM